ncbi:MAG: DUF1957 domain-containing protein [Thermodesulfovibrionales bacterium]|nr:DUF1957 domain-containing protein [Thermodesulfovibrionales bacterium]
MYQEKRVSILLLLHSHLPFLRECQIKEPVEETWFFEAVIESYIPLIRIFEELAERKVTFRVVLSLSPTLLEMLDDPYLMNRLKEHLNNLDSLIKRELRRKKRTVFYEIVEFYRKRIEETDYFLRRRKITKAFQDLAKNGYLDLITTAATHAYLPLFSSYPHVVWLQIKTGLEIFRRHIKLRGGALQGFWLPECGYYEGLFPLLRKAHIDWTVLEAHGIVFGRPVPPEGIFRPVLSPEGILLFARDAETCRFVWSKDIGYPGNPWYRDFYKDVCYELSDSEWRLFRKDGIRHHTGLKYYRIGGKEKKPYIREKALNIANLHAVDFVKKLEARASQAMELTERPVIVLAFDTELFGHWWFEGPEWLKKIIELIAVNDKLRLIIPEDVLDNNSRFREVLPVSSSWGEGGFNSTWLSKENSAYVKAIYRAIEEAPASIFKSSNARPFRKPSALREFLLMQSSDFLFMLKRDENSKRYGERRLKEHLMAFYKALF